MSKQVGAMATGDTEEEERIIKRFPPKFVESFQPVRLLQGSDACFAGMIDGSPKPEVSWSRNGQPLSKSSKYKLNFNPESGYVSLKIVDVGPGDEGVYSCCIVNPYSDCKVSLNMNPEKRSRLCHPKPIIEFSKNPERGTLLRTKQQEKAAAAATAAEKEANVRSAIPSL